MTNFKRDFRKTFSVTDEFLDVRKYLIELEKSGKNKSRTVCLALREYINKKQDRETNLEDIKNILQNFNTKLNDINKKLDVRIPKYNTVTLSNNSYNDNMDINKKNLDKISSILDF
jgi:hypothetical protein